ncbi:thioredoxin-like protein [Exidia glandulosa HHB12029]|uniref:Thioredoxin-like protein n=1 Tax=Exidia glandulosa HHB12029 TaxID=1314781 RepID=A0A165MDP7_EXIGL|nr:thioredoxin-like protein [Exidia glandulosa HHB12029]
MALNPHEDTEFNDALRKHGILPPKTPPPRTPSPKASLTLDELDLLDDELRDLAEDAHDSETERTLETYRRKRLAELTRESKRGRFGEVIPIGRDDYKREVTEASALSEDGDELQSGTGVVCLLYKDGCASQHEASDRLWPQIRTLARRHPRTKFVSIIGDKCIPNYPDVHLPTIFVYRKGDVTGQVTAWGAKVPKDIDALEELLIQTLAIPPDEKPSTDERERRNSSDDERPTNRISKPSRSRPSRTNDDDDDSDFDL